MPKVSVILTSYNHAKYICEAIESTLNQTFSDFELIIIDDCSSDDSWDLINQYSDSRIRAYRNEVNDGGVVGLNKAISEWARGEYIAVHHSDDVWEIDKLEIQCAFLDIHNEIGAVFTKATPIAEDGSSFLEKNHFYSDIFDQPNRTRHEWLRFFFNDLNALCHPSVLVRKSVYENCGLYRLGLVQTTDYEMWIRVCLKYEIFIIQENLVKFRVRDNEANSSGTRPETRRRGVYELYEAFHSFLGIQGSDDLFRVFPSLVRFDRGNETDIEFVLAMAAIYEKPFCSKQLFGLDFLYRIISDPVRSDKVKALYDFGLHDFTELTGKIDIFSREEVSDLWLGLQARDGQIGSLNQAVAERDGQIGSLNQAVAERDGQIGSLNQAVVERDGQIGSLSQAMAEQDKLHQQTLSHIWNSTSWRLTMPLRSLGMYARRLIHIIKITPHIIKHGNEIKDTANETLLIYKNEGMDGVRRRLASLRSPAQPRSTIPDNLLSIEPQNTAEIPRIEFDQTHNRFVGYQKNPTITPMVKLIAFYLPQFHPFPENDEWWGKGFTEWTNVGRAKPNYSGHYQPHCPIHNGYYDLRVPEVMEEQARLAKEYGVYGFSYYFYWFDGKILMDTPLEMMLANKNVDMPFCFTWANENWSRRWDGQENDILIAQNHSDQDSLEFIRHLIRYFKDDRYICIEGKPVLIIYRANIIPNMAGTAKIWRDELLKNGFPGLYLVSAQSFGIRSPDPFDFDASVEFPPHTVISSDISNELDISNADYCGHIFSYDQVVANTVLTEEPDYKLFRTAMLSWDNTARKQNNGHIFHGFSLLRYKQWLSSIVNKMYSNEKYSTDEKFVFVNAWNEWAEGTHLEPDQKFGYGYLQTTYDVLRNYESMVLKEQFKPFSYDKRSECAVILHLHYTELWTSISEYLKHSFDGINFDLFVSVTSSDAFKTVLADFPRAHVELVENRGRDILPFIRMLNFIKGFDYTAVCKIHSKRSIYRNDGDKIRDELLDALMGSKEQIEDILSRFVDDSKLGMVAPTKYLVEHTDHNMTFDKERVWNIANHMNISFQYDVFPAGSMFWFSPKSLSPLLKLDDRFFEIESGLADGTCAHAVERLFCQIVKSSNFVIEGCEFKDFSVSVSV